MALRSSDGLGEPRGNQAWTFVEEALQSIHRTKPAIMNLSRLAGVAVETADFMPSETVIAGIRKDIEAYEAARASAVRQVRWRGPGFVGLGLG
ncbi:hypothetical protein EN956_32160, partial [Mesorhizobium sp. M7A.F.Ca.CA.004.05.2.1]